MSTFISRADSRRQARGRKKKEVLRLPSLFFRIFASGFNCYTTWLEGKAGKWNIIFAVCLVMAKTHTGPSRGQPEAALACLERNSVPARDFSIKIPLRTPLAGPSAQKSRGNQSKKHSWSCRVDWKEKKALTRSIQNRPRLYIKFLFSITFHSNHFVSYAIALARLFGHDIFIARFWKSTFNEIWGVWQIIKSKFQRRMPGIPVLLAGLPVS